MNARNEIRREAYSFRVRRLTCTRLFVTNGRKTGLLPHRDERWGQQIISRIAMQPQVKKGSMMNALQGKKTYIVAALTVVWAWTGVALGVHDVSTAMNLTLAAPGAFGFRSALK